MDMPCILLHTRGSMPLLSEQVGFQLAPRNALSTGHRSVTRNVYDIVNHSI